MKKKRFINIPNVHCAHGNIISIFRCGFSSTFRLFQSLFLEQILSLICRIVTFTVILNENLREVREYGKPQNQSLKGSAPVLKYAHFVDQITASRLAH